MSVKNKAEKLFRVLKTKTDYLSVKQYYERKGWKIIPFLNDSRIITDLQLQNKINSNGFIFCDEQMKYIFIRSNLTLREKRNVMFHEAGHIELNHMYSDLCLEAQEREATEFANVLIRKCRKNTKNNLIISTAVILLLFAALCTLLFCNFGIGKSDEIPAERTAAPVTKVQNLHNNPPEVYVTPGGHRYHLKDCAHIKYNAAKQKINVETAAQLYKPCLDCIN